MLCLTPTTPPTAARIICTPNGASARRHSSPAVSLGFSCFVPFRDLFAKQAKEWFPDDWEGLAQRREAAVVLCIGGPSSDHFTVLGIDISAIAGWISISIKYDFPMIHRDYPNRANARRQIDGGDPEWNRPLAKNVKSPTSNPAQIIVRDQHLRPLGLRAPGSDGVGRLHLLKPEVFERFPHPLNVV